ncbi:hypothetical protein [Phenylobacterium sp.]|uniref:hypothetical protein n=1 Tax=Phenylobacterium sp. TaxID=1871053 RepID=UPI002FC68EF7
MRNALRAVLPALAVLSLAACATITPAPAGPLKVGSGANVTLGRQWSDISLVMPGRHKKVRVLSIDGPLLNRLYLTDGLAPGDYLIKPLAKERPTPLVRADMSATERMEFVTDSISAMDYQRVTLAKPRPAKLGEASGVRFDVSAQTAEGLEIKGVAAVAETGGKIYVILYLAPAEHYFAATLPEAEAVMASARVG